MKILAVIPAYNEEDCLEQTVCSLAAACPDVHYLVINDGSTDATESICRRAGMPHLTLPVNSGLACGFQAGMKYAQRHDYDAVVQFDADGQHLPEYITPMADALRERDADVVIASRVRGGQAIAGARGVGSRLIAGLIRLTTGTRITDPTSGMRMYNRRAIADFARRHDYTPEPDTMAVIARKGGVIVEIPARMQERQGGTSYLDLPHVVSYMSRTCASILFFQWFR